MAQPVRVPAQSAPPFLERYPEQGGPVEQIPLCKLPFTIGRAETCDHVIYSSKVSREHALIVRTDDSFAVRDLDSTNGTFVNGQRTPEHPLDDGDILHVAHVEFRFRHEARPVAANPRAGSRADQTQMMPTERPDSLIRGAQLLEEMLKTEAVEILYQPIVDLESRVVVGYEALGRGKHPQLPSSPDTLLQLAAQCGLVIRLSRLWGKLAVTRCKHLPRDAKIFVNLHAQDLAESDFHKSLAGLRRVAKGRPIVIEIAEASVTDVADMARHKDALTNLGFEFAYDDFGAGQARLLELTDMPPNYLKLDKSLIAGIDLAASRRDMVAALLSVTDTLGVQVIAEGIETEEAATICHELGCVMGQGYLFSRPDDRPSRCGRRNGVRRRRR